MKGSSYSKQIYELIGVRVIDKKKKITYSGKYAGDEGWLLDITCETKPEIKTIAAFTGMVGTYGDVGQEKIWKDIEKSEYADKRYIFYCHRKDIVKYALAGWKELENK